MDSRNGTEEERREDTQRFKIRKGCETGPRKSLGILVYDTRGSESDFSGKVCQLRRSTQHHPMLSFDNASREEPICLTVLAQNLARVAFRLI